MTTWCMNVADPNHTMFRQLTESSDEDGFDA
jgi:hypothetical protein